MVAMRMRMIVAGLAASWCSEAAEAGACRTRQVKRLGLLVDRAIASSYRLGVTLYDSS